MVKYLLNLKSNTLPFKKDLVYTKYVTNYLNFYETMFWYV